MTYTLITANRNYLNWTLRPWLLMSALDIDFSDRVEPFTFTKPGNRDDFRTFSPTGHVPVMIEAAPSGGARTIWDSLAIILYLADRHDNVWPTHPAARAWAQSGVERAVRRYRVGGHHPGSPGDARVGAPGARRKLARGLARG